MPEIPELVKLKLELMSIAYAYYAPKFARGAKIGSSERYLLWGKNPHTGNQDAFEMTLPFTEEHWDEVLAFIADMWAKQLKDPPPERRPDPKTMMALADAHMDVAWDKIHVAQPGK